MNKLKNNQSGFSAVEIVMVVVIVGLLGIVGWLVYKGQKKTQVPTASTSPATTKQAAATSTPNNTVTDPNQGYVVVKAWGVRFKPTGAAANTYVGDKNTHDSEAYNLRSADLDKWPDCKTGDGSVAVIARVAGDPVYAEAGGDGVKHYSEIFKGNTVGNYFYYIQRAQYLCDGGSDNTELVSKVERAMVDSSTTIEAIK